MRSLLQFAPWILLLQQITGVTGGFTDDDCCLCEDCDVVVSNVGQDAILQISPHNQYPPLDGLELDTGAVTCEDVALHLYLHHTAWDDQCIEQRELFRDVCCHRESQDSMMSRDPSASTSSGRRELVWSAPSKKQKNTSYLSWSSSASSKPIGASSTTFTNSLAQWASTLSDLFANTPAGSTNQIINLPPSTPTSLFQFPRPSPPTAGSFPRPTPPTFTFPRPTPPTFTFPRPTPPTFTFPRPSFPAPTPPAFPRPTLTTSSGGGGGGSSSSQAWVNAHNTRRSQHHRQNGVSFVPVQWSNELAASANAYTQRLLNGFSGCNIQHNFQGDSYGGENLALQVTQSATSAITPDGVLRLWYEGEIGLPYPQNGHLTQVVWRSTQYVGCAMGTKRNGNGGFCHIQTCRYLAPGNCNGPTALLETSTPCGPQCPVREGCF